MLTRKHDQREILVKPVINKTVIKRRYSKIKDKNHSSEPIKKIRKLKENKDDDDENDIENGNIDENVIENGSEFKDFIKYFSMPSNIYKYISTNCKSNPVMLKRCLPYNKMVQSDVTKSNIQSIADHLSTVRFHDENIALIKGKSPNRIKTITPTKFILKFEQFLDSSMQKDWITVEADIIVDVVHLHRDNRKNKNGFCVSRVFDRQRISCNKISLEEGRSDVIDVGEVMAAAMSYRVYKSLLHFKILAKEKKILAKNFSIEKKTTDIYPVTYEAMIPFYVGRDELHVQKESYFIQTGKYEIFPRVTNMEACDDSMFSGEMKDAYNPDNEKGNDLDCQWIKLDELQSFGANKSATKLIFTITNEEPPKPATRPLKNRSKILQPTTKLSPTKNGDFCLSSVRIEKKAKVDANIAFKFLVQGNIVQWTKTSNLTCPWCQLNFRVVSDLFETLRKMLTHLNFMHPKFTFNCNKLSNRESFMKSLPKKFITIDVTLTEKDLSDWDLGLVHSEKYPMRRVPLSEVIYNKFQKAMSKPFHRENHNRDYCHTWSSRKNKYIEFDIDSEAEENMSWLFDHYSRKVEEFSDLNHMEKRVIQLWNESLLRYGFCIGDSQMKDFVEHFVREVIDNGSKLREVSTLRNTLMLHLVNLIDYGLLPPSVMLRCMKSLDLAIEGTP